MKQSIKERLHALRMTFHPNHIKAFIIPSTDPHLSEYVAPYWMSREWISGFTGSAGTAVLLMDKAGLWTDSRYFLQAEKELEGSGITLYKEMLPETPSITAFLCQNLKPGESVSIDGKMFSCIFDVIDEGRSIGHGRTVLPYAFQRVAKHIDL